MSTATLDLTATPAVPLDRLVKVELRKMTDTRAGFWLLFTMAAIALLAVVVFGFAAPDRDHRFGNFVAFTSIPQAFLLPVLGILLITQEWGQRTGMITFTLEPKRSRVITAKVVAAVVLGLAVLVVAIVAAALATLVFAGTDGFSGTSAVDFAHFVWMQVSGVLQGLAFGLLFLSTALAIVTYFVLPSVIGIVVNVWSRLAEHAAWIDLGTATTPMIDEHPGALTGEQWGQVLVTTLVWVVLPFVAGLWRVLRAEVK